MKIKKYETRGVTAADGDGTCFSLIVAMRTAFG